MKSLTTLLAVLLSIATLSGYGQLRSTENVGMGMIIVIELGGNGDIWAGSASQGVGFYQASTQQWSYFNTGNTPKMQSDSITSLTFGLINGTQHAFIGTKSGLVDIRAGIADTIVVPYTRRVTGVSLVHDTLWASTDSGLVSFDTLKHVISALNTVDASLPFDRTSASQRGGTQCMGIAAGTPNNGFFYTTTYDTFVRVDTSGPHYRLVDNRVNTLYKENQCNRFLVGTKGGLSLCPIGIPCQNFTTANGLPQNDVTTIAVDCHGAIWIGMRDSGVAIFNNPGFTRLTRANGLSTDQVTSLSFSGPDCKAYIAGTDGNISIVDSTRHVVQVINGVADVTASQSEVIVYPQPSSGSVNFVFNKEIGEGEIVLTDLNGRTVQSLGIRNASNTSADISSLPDGLYFYRLTAGGQQLKTGKVLVIK